MINSFKKNTLIEHSKKHTSTSKEFTKKLERDIIDIFPKKTCKWSKEYEVMLSLLIIK